VPHPARPPSAYHARLQRVSDYIHDHLDQPLGMMQLAEMGCLSPHHWHRIYASFFGETMAVTVKRLRLQRAAGYLAQTALPVQQVARRSGYANVQSFTRTFSEAYGLAPVQYRTRGQHVQFQYTGPEYEDGAFEVREVNIEPIALMGVPHHGSYMDISKAFTTLYAWLAAHGINGQGLRCIGIYFDDPFAASEKSLRSLACVACINAVVPPGGALPMEAPFQQAIVAGGRHAVLRYRGPYASMHAAYQWLFGYWLLKSGEQAADAPVFEDYLNSPLDTAPADLLTDIYMPLLE